MRTGARRFARGAPFKVNIFDPESRSAAFCVSRRPSFLPRRFGAIPCCFVIDDAGVPSIAKHVRLKADHDDDED